LVCVHAEASVHLERTVSLIDHLGAKSAVALNPATPLCAIEYLLPQLDMVLLMSVNPGFGGQEFIPFTREKLKSLNEMIKPLPKKPHVQIDGGVSPENVGELAALGANIFVSGSAFFKHPPYDERHNQFLQAAQDG
jgi:ribulose-phosphate 3-epimerase